MITNDSFVLNVILNFRIKNTCNSVNDFNGYTVFTLKLSFLLDETLFCFRQILTGTLSVEPEANSFLR